MDTKWTLVLFIYFILLLQQGHGFTDIARREWKLVPHQTSKWNPIQLSGTLTGQLGQSFHQCICREVFSSRTLDVTLQCCWIHLGASAEERQPTLPSPLSALGQPCPWACRLQSFWHSFYLNEINVFVCLFVSQLLLTWYRQRKIYIISPGCFSELIWPFSIWQGNNSGTANQ